MGSNINSKAGISSGPGAYEVLTRLYLNEDKNSDKGGRVNKTHDVENKLKSPLSASPKRGAKKPRMRYNPYKDPNFDPDAPEFHNEEFASNSAVNLQTQALSEEGRSPIHYADGSSSQYHSSSDASASSEKIVITQCKMKRQRFVSDPFTQSQIGGGKAFRESQVKNAKNEWQKNNLKSFASRIKANSLSDIESINSEEETDQNESTTGIGKSPVIEPTPVVSDSSSEGDQAPNENNLNNNEFDPVTNLEKIRKVPFIAKKIVEGKLKSVEFHQ